MPGAAGAVVTDLVNDWVMAVAPPVPSSMVKVVLVAAYAVEEALSLMCTVVCAIDPFVGVSVKLALKVLLSVENSMAELFETMVTLAPRLFPATVNDCDAETVLIQPFSAVMVPTTVRVGDSFSLFLPIAISV